MKFIPYEKMSKKAQKAENRRVRGSWGVLNPCTKVQTTDARKHPSRAQAKRLAQKEMAW